MDTVVKVAHPARRGDLLVVELERHDYVIGQASQSRLEYKVVEVTGIRRDGSVREIRDLDWDGASTSPLDRQVGLQRVWLMEAAALRKDVLLGEIRAHRWPSSPDSPMIRPWDSLEELARLIARHRTAKTGWQVR